MRKCDKDGRDCGVCTDACVMTMAAPAALKPLYVKVAGCTFDNTGEGHCLHAGCEPAGFCLEKHPGARLVDTANPKDAMGAAKPSMGLIPVGAMEAVARVMELGAKKYGPYNWRSKAVKKMVYAHAALRHLFAWIGGQDKDPESGESHMAHVAACMLIVLDADTRGQAIDDREWVK